MPHRISKTWIVPPSRTQAVRGCLSEAGAKSQSGYAGGHGPQDIPGSEQAGIVEGQPAGHAVAELAQEFHIQPEPSPGVQGKGYGQRVDPGLQDKFCRQSADEALARGVIAEIREGSKRPHKGDPGPGRQVHCLGGQDHVTCQGEKRTVEHHRGKAEIQGQLDQVEVAGMAQDHRHRN